MRAPVHAASTSWWIVRATSDTVAGGTAQEDPDQARQIPDRVTQRLEALFVENRYAERALGRRRFVRLRRDDERRLLDRRELELRADGVERLGLCGVMAEHDSVGATQHAEQCPTPAPALGGTLDQPGNLDELDEHAAQSRQRRDRPCGREGVVPGLDLDL